MLELLYLPELALLQIPETVFLTAAVLSVTKGFRIPVTALLQIPVTVSPMAAVLLMIKGPLIPETVSLTAAVLTKVMRGIAQTVMAAGLVLKAMVPAVKVVVPAVTVTAPVVIVDARAFLITDICVSLCRRVNKLVVNNDG